MLIDSCKSDRGHILKKMNLQVIHDNISIMMEAYSSRQLDSITRDELRELWDEYSKVTDDLKYNSHPIKHKFLFYDRWKRLLFLLYV